MLHICPRIPGQSFAKLPFKNEILDFIQFLGYSAAIKTLIDGLYHKRNVDYTFWMWEDFVYQVEHKNKKKNNEMYYPRFTKVIIHYFMSKDPSVPRRNKVNWHYVRDDFMFSTIKLVSRHQNTQQFGALLPIELTNEEIRNSKAYKEYYAIATGKAAPKPKTSVRRTKSGSDTSITPPTATATPRLTAAVKGKQTAKASKAKSLSALFEVAMTEAQQLKLVTRRSMQQTYISQPSGSGADEGTGSKPGVLDESEENDDKDDTKKNRDDEEEGRSDEHEFDEEETDEETREEESFDHIPQTPKSSEDEGNGEEDIGLIVEREEGLNEEEEADELYIDVNINQERGIQATLEVEDSHVTLTLVNPDGMESIFETASTSVAPLPITAPTMTLSTIATITTTSQAPILPTTKIIKEQVKDQVKVQVSRILPRIEQSVNEQLEAEVLTRLSHSSRTSYAVAADLSEMELKKILIEKIEGNKSIQRSHEQRNLYKALVEAYKADKIILDTYRETVTLKKRHDDDANKDKGSSAGPDRGSKRCREGKEPESASAPSETATRSAVRSTTGSRSRQTSTSDSAFAEEPKPPTLDRDWNKTLPAVHRSVQPWISKLAKHADSRSSFDELMDTPLDFSNFLMNRLRVDTLTPELLAGPTYELMKGSCKSLVELEYHLKEVYKATTDQLDWVNPEGQQYPHNLLQPLPLIPDNRGRRVILFAHFINNDLEYLRGGASSRKYTTSITNTKATDYGHIKWIEDLVPRTMWINKPIGYDKHALWKSPIGGVNVRSSTVLLLTDNDDKLYKFEEGDFKRLRIQDIEDMLLFLVQGKLTNLTIEERFAFNVSLRMFTRSIVIQRRMEDLQLGVESYQKRLNLTKPDTYRSDQKHREADGTLIDVRTALDDRLKGIRMRYLPQTIWRKSDKDRVAAMIQAIDKRLKTRRIMRSLERMKMEILLEPTSNKLMVASDTLIDFQIKFSISIGETVTHWFTLIVLSALRRSDNENTLSLINLILRDCHEVFSNDLSGLPPNREINFHIKLVPGAIRVMKSPYRLAPSEMEELSG
uniref:Reverse transcriptase domain-containing protein n=1 Tax=Tanacetum cinerariifolium TaxID=118510 RepID=A0A6L2MXQ7_TANCI|nr:reverse transcriptase domain-containing protein [Tanacetum cinerariifolium]